MEWQGLTGADESRRSTSFLRTGQGDAAAEVDEDQGVAAAAELELSGVRGGRRWKRGVNEGLWAGPIYKGD